MKIQGKLITSHVLLLVVPLIFLVGVIIYIVTSLMTHISNDTNTALKTDAYHMLDAVNNLKAEQLKDYLHEQQLTLETIASSMAVADTFKAADAYEKKMTKEADGIFDITTAEYKTLWDKHSHLFAPYIDKDKYNWYDIFIISKSQGHVMYSQFKEPDLGQNLKIGALKDEGLGKLYQKIRASDKTEFIDFSPYSPSRNLPAAFMGTPIVIDGNIVGILAMQFPLEKINSIMNNRTGMRETGESYLVGADYKMRSDSFFEPETHSVKASFSDNTLNKSQMIDKALSGKRGTMIAEDRIGSGNIVVSNYKPFEFLGVTWALISEIHEPEVLATAYEVNEHSAKGLNQIYHSSLAITLLFVGIGIVISLIVARRMSKPIIFIEEALQQVSKVVATVSDTLKNDLACGDWSRAITVDNVEHLQKDMLIFSKKRDEIGKISLAALDILHKTQTAANATNICIDQFNETLSQVNLSVVEVASGSTQVAAASQMLSAGATESSASLEEISSSMTEIANQTQINADNAAQANQFARQASSSANIGKEKMIQMSESMSRINMNAEATKKIIKTIDDIAFQTNLLALNAAVEAARAGYHGKGFSVVAEEVRNLAAKSAQASAETSQLIEKNNNEIRIGVEVSEQTSEALEDIVHNVSRTFELVVDIAAASNEQAQGISQINEGLTQIESVTMQNTASAEETACASEEMSAQSDKLQELVSTFRLKGEQTNTNRPKETLLIADTERDYEPEYTVTPVERPTYNIPLEDYSFAGI